MRSPYRNLEVGEQGLLPPLGKRGEYTYLCMIHEAAGMIGRITVR